MELLPSGPRTKIARAILLSLIFTYSIYTVSVNTPRDWEFWFSCANMTFIGFMMNYSTR